MADMIGAAGRGIDFAKGNLTRTLIKSALINAANKKINQDAFFYTSGGFGAACGSWNL